VRFSRISIPGYGPFTDFDLELTKNHSHDLHVVCGSNEAGKSSLLRAIKHLLYGIPVRTADDFLHRYADLKLAATVESGSSSGSSSSKGEQLSFTRFKRQKNALEDSSGVVIAESRLQKFLATTDEAYFSGFFGLNADSLHRGASQLLDADGKIGETLFSVNASGTRLRAYLQDLEQQAQELYKPRARKNIKIVDAKSRHEELRKTTSQQLIKPLDWQALQQLIGRKEAERTDLNAELTNINRQVDWINRAQSAIPIVHKIRDLGNQLESLPVFPAIEVQSIADVRSALVQRSRLEGNASRIADDIDQCRQDLTCYEVNCEVLELEDALENLHSNLSAYKARTQRIREQRIQVSQVYEKISQSMRKLQLNGELQELDKHRLTEPVKLAVYQAADELVLVTDAELLTRQKIAQLMEDITSAVVDDSEKIDWRPIDTQQLRDALELSGRANDACDELAALEQKIELRTLELARINSHLHDAPAEISNTIALAVPGSATVRKFRAEIEGLQQNLDNYRHALLGHQQTLGELFFDLSRLRKKGAFSGELPTLAKLGQTRSARDLLWVQVKRLLQGDKQPEEIDALISEFQKRKEYADTIADKLREQADLLGQLEDKTDRQQRAQQTIDQVGCKIEEATQQLELTKVQWEELWQRCGVNALSPDEMQEWLDQWQRLSQGYGELLQDKSTLERKQSQVEAARQALLRVCDGDARLDLPRLHRQAQEQLTNAEQALGKREQRAVERKKKKAQLEALKTQLVSAQVDLNAKQSAWVRQCAIAGLDNSTTPKNGLDLLSQKNALIDLFDVYQEKESAVVADERLASEYEQEVRQVSRELNVDASSVVADAASTLFQMLRRSKETHTKRRELLDRLDRLQTEYKRSKDELQTVVSTITDMGNLLRVLPGSSLTAVLDQFDRRAKIQLELDNCKSKLLGFARDEPLEEFLQAVAQEDTAGLEARTRELLQQQEEIEQQIKDISDELGGLKADIRKVERASDEAAASRQALENTKTELKNHALRYIKLRLAKDFLDQQIEKFRNENQGPMLEKTSEYFSKLTLNSFKSVKPDYTDSGAAVIVGEKASGQKITVARMSDGTRDQLYLALRLAALDIHLQTHEPMPLILDDLLITFDNQRAIAMLEQLRNLSQQTQVILFTHHEHIFELCRQNLLPSQFAEHRI